MARRRYRKPPSLSTLQILFIFCATFAVLGGMWIMQTFSIDDITVFLVGLGVLFVLVIAVMYGIGKRKRELAKALQLADVDTMTGVEFEQYVGRLLQFQKYKIEFTPTSGDFGVDILAAKEGIVSAVQLKRYKGKVGVEAVNQAVAGKGYYKAHSCIVVTNSYFTNAAYKLAWSNQCELVDRDTLAQWILRFQA